MDSSFVMGFFPGFEVFFKGKTGIFGLFFPDCIISPINEGFATC
jgi:hypothetical protein